MCANKGQIVRLNINLLHEVRIGIHFCKPFLNSFIRLVIVNYRVIEVTLHVAKWSYNICKVSDFLRV